MPRLQNITNILFTHVFQRNILNQSVIGSYKNDLSNGRQYSRNGNNSEDKKSGLFSIGNILLNIIGTITIPITLYYLNKRNADYEEREKTLKEMYSQMRKFVNEYEKAKDNRMDFDKIQQIGQNVISVIVHRKDLQKHIKQNFDVYRSSGYADFLKMILYSTKESLNHYYNIQDVESIIDFVIHDIIIDIDNFRTEDRCFKLTSELYFQYARVLYFNNKASGAKDCLNKVQGIIQKHSYMKILVEHLFNIMELKYLKQEINIVDIKYNLELKKFQLNHDVDKTKIEKLIKDNAVYIRKYESLKEDNQSYIDNRSIEKANYIIPKKYAAHQLMCQTMLLRLYTTSLFLKSVLDIKDEDDIQHIANLINDLEQSLHPKDKDYNKIIHCHLLDTLNIVSKCTEGDDEFNKKVIKLMTGCVTKEVLSSHYKNNAKDALSVLYSNTQFHCVQNKIDSTTDSKTLCEYMQNCFDNCYQAFSVNDFSVIGETNNLYSADN